MRRRSHCWQLHSPCRAASWRRRAPAAWRVHDSAAHLAAARHQISLPRSPARRSCSASTPLAATITVIDLMGAANIVRAQTFRTYEPLLVVAVVYVALAIVIALAFRFLERRVPSPR